MKRPIIAITMGDPASIGPEITLKALSDKKIYDICRPVVVGNADVLHRAREWTDTKKSIMIHRIASVGEAQFVPGTVDVLHIETGSLDEIPMGQVSAEGGDSAFQYVKRTIELAMAGQVDATVTNALNKEAIHRAGHQFSGHTEIYAHYTGVKQYAMLLVHENLRVIHVSTHVSLREACNRVKKGRVLEVIQMADRACKALGITNPRVAVAGLNPHSGEDGLFGDEEATEIGPAIAQAKEMGILAEGPIPPDTIFPKARGGWYDIVVAMYHDQGHIPLKMAGFVYDAASQRWKSVSGVNITLGLPIIRTSVDHGTAFDLAGKGEADATSLKSAIQYAVDLAENR